MGAAGRRGGAPPPQQSDAHETLESAFGGGEEGGGTRRLLPGHGAEPSPQQQRPHPASPSGDGVPAADSDALDAFMGQMAQGVESDKARPPPPFPATNPCSCRLLPCSVRRCCHGGAGLGAAASAVLRSASHRSVLCFTDHYDRYAAQLCLLFVHITIRKVS